MTSPAGLLARAGFRRLYAIRLLSQGADGIFEAGLVSFVVFSPERAASAGAIAASLAVVLLPFSAAEPFTGILIDRVSRQRVLWLANAVRVGLLLILAVLIAGHHSGPGFLTVALLIFSVQRFVLSALSAALPVVVSGDDLVTGNSLSTTSGTVFTLLGAGLGAGMRHVVGAQDSGIAVIAATAAGGYLIAALAALTVQRSEFGPTGGPPTVSAAQATRRVVADMAAGAVYLARQARARDALLALTVHRFCYGISFVATVLLYRNYFPSRGGGGIGGLAEVLAAGGAGTILAAVVTPRVTRGIGKQAWITALLATAAVGEVVFGFPYTTGWLLAASVVIGFVAQGAKICVDTTVQEEVIDAFRGRAFSVYDLLFNVSYVGAAAVAALIVPRTGKSYVVLGAIATGYALAAVGYGLVSSRERRRSEAVVASARR